MAARFRLIVPEIRRHVENVPPHPLPIHARCFSIATGKSGRAQATSRVLTRPRTGGSAEEIAGPSTGLCPSQLRRLRPLFSNTRALELIERPETAHTVQVFNGRTNPFLNGR